MRTSLLATAAALALVVGPALAQQTPGGPATRGPAGAPQMAAPRAPLPNPLTQEDVSKIKGTDVYGADDKKLGSIDTVLIDPQTKMIDRLVVKAGGVLGVGGHDVALALDQFKWDGAKEGFLVSKTADELKAMPEWKAANAGAPAERLERPLGGAASSGASGDTGASAMGKGSATPGVPAR
jgi:hypothetical protein